MFYSSYIVGFEELVKEIILNKYPDVKPYHVLNGAIITKTLSSNNIINIPFLNNHFKIIKLDNENNIIKFISNLDNIKLNKEHINKSFRIIISDQNNLISIDNNVLKRLEDTIQRQTNNYVNRLKPDIEYWVLKRSEGIILFMERLNKHKSFDKDLNKGELRNDLCYFLNYLSDPKATDIFLDPFCGSGAIINNRLKIDKLNMVFGIDIKPEYIKELKNKYKKNNIIFKNINFFDNKYENNFIDKIVTDPPWGLFEKLDNVEKFYQNMINEFERIIKPDGIIVILTACKDEMNLIKTNLKLIKSFNILVSGKKAGIFVFKK